MSEPVVTVNNLGKTYWLYPSTGRRLMGCFVNPLRVGARAFSALSGLSFDLHPGEAIALIGKNGAGKSTALQLLAGIVPPTEGGFQIKGRVCALLELGSGFNPEFTGRQNIALSGTLIGLTQEQIRQEEQNIIDFAEIGEFIDQPVKFYSSGMFVRLAFAVVMAGRPDLLIVDEALAVGDVFFRQKCYARLREMRKKGMAVILVTHSMADVTEFCDRAILLDRGKQVYSGDTKEATLLYYAIANRKKGLSSKPTDDKDGNGSIDIVDDAHKDAQWLSSPDIIHPDINKQITNGDGSFIRSILLTDNKGNSSLSFTQGSYAHIYVEYFVNKRIRMPIPGYVIWNSRMIAVHGKNLLHDSRNIPEYVPAGTSLLTHTKIKLDLEAGEYTLNIGLSHIPVNAVGADYKNAINSIDDVGERVAHMHNCIAFVIVHDASRRPLVQTHHGIANLSAEQKITLMHSVE